MGVLQNTPRGKVCLDADGSGTTLAWGDTGLEVGANGESGELETGGKHLSLYPLTSNE